MILLVYRIKRGVTLMSAYISTMNKSQNSNRAANEEDANRQRMPDPENPLVEKFDEADPLHDRSPAGDSGPEDAEKKKGPAPQSMTY